MEVNLANVLIGSALLTHFLLFSSMFVKLENRLTKLETTLEIINKSLGNATFIDRREV